MLFLVEDVGANFSKTKRNLPLNGELVNYSSGRVCHASLTARKAMMRSALFLLVFSLLAGPFASAQPAPVALTGAKVYPVSGPPLERATVLMVNGKITAVGANVAVPSNARRIDL